MNTNTPFQVFAQGVINVFINQQAQVPSPITVDDPYGDVLGTVEKLNKFLNEEHPKLFADTLVSGDDTLIVVSSDETALIEAFANLNLRRPKCTVN